MTLPRASEKDRFLQILGQAKYELNDGVHIPYMVRRKFTTEEYDYINGICKYIEHMIDTFDRKGLLVKAEYDAKTCENCPIAQNYNLEDDDTPCQNCVEDPE